MQETRPYLLVRALCVLYTAAVLAIRSPPVMLGTVSQSFLSNILPPRLGSGTGCSRRPPALTAGSSPGSCCWSPRSASYLVFPCQRSTLRQVLPGSLAASCGWVIFSGLFSHYVKRLGASSIY